MVTDRQLNKAIVNAHPEIKEAFIHHMSNFFDGTISIKGKGKKQRYKVSLSFLASDLLADHIKGKQGYSLPLKNSDFQMVPYLVFIKWKEK